MRFMVLIKANKDYEAGIPPSEQLMAAMASLSEEMTKSGVLLATEGLQRSAMATRIRHAGGKTSVTDGPFAETKELIGGFAIIRVDSKQEALDLTQRVVQIHIDAGVQEFDVELRPMYDSGEDLFTDPLGRC